VRVEAKHIALAPLAVAHPPPIETSHASPIEMSLRHAAFDRRTAYAHRLADPEFAADWDDALEASIDDLEGEARRRAMEGVAEPVVSMGRVVEVVDDEARKSPLNAR
jgi:hypothetical protein